MFVVPILMPDGSRPTGGSKRRPDAEEDRGGKAYQGQERERPEGQGGQNPYDQWSEGRLDRIHEAEPLTDKAAGEQVPHTCSSEGDQKLDHRVIPGRGMSVALQYETYLGKIHAEYALKEPRSYCERTYRGWQ